MTTAFLLGAGFSKWAADVPAAAQLFDFEIESTTTDLRKLDLVRQCKSLWDGVRPGAPAEQFIAHVLEHGSPAERSALTWYVTRRLNEPFLWVRNYGGKERRRTLSIDETFKHHLPGISKVSEFLAAQHVDTAEGIVTTNYDLLVEYALGSGGFNYGRYGEQLHGAGGHPMRRAPVLLRGRLPLAKLHGSISWDNGIRYSDGRRALTGNALIVAPVPEKRPPSGLEEAWTLAADILARSERVVVFGFAFNPYDVAVLDLLTRWGKGVRQVDLYDLVPPVDRAREVWPSAVLSPLNPP